MFGSNRIPSEFSERLYAALMPYYECDINCVLELGGRIDVEQLTNAFLSALAEEPMWSYRFVPAFWRPFWLPIPRGQRHELVQVIKTDDPSAAWAAVFRAPVDAAVRLFVLHGPVDDALCFRVDHRLADATAAHLLIGSVAKHLAAGTQPPDKDAPLVRRTMKLLRHAVTENQRKELLARFREHVRSFRAAPAPFRLPLATADDPGDVGEMLHFPEGSLDELTARAMRDRATPTLAIGAATYLALRDIFGIAPQAPLDMALAVNLRRYLAPEHLPAHASMYLGRAHILVQESGATSMAAVIEQLRLGLAKERGPVMGMTVSLVPFDFPVARFLMGLIPFSSMLSAMRKAARNEQTKPDVAINDQGEYGRPGDQWGQARLKNGYSFPGVWGLPATIAIFSGTCGSRLNIAIGTSPRSFARNLAIRIRTHLCDYVGWSNTEAI